MLSQLWHLFFVNYILFLLQDFFLQKTAFDLLFWFDTNWFSLITSGETTSEWLQFTWRFVEISLCIEIASYFIIGRHAECMMQLHFLMWHYFQQQHLYWFQMVHQAISYLGHFSFSFSSDFFTYQLDLSLFFLNLLSSSSLTCFRFSDYFLCFFRYCESCLSWIRLSCATPIANDKWRNNF